MVMFFVTFAGILCGLFKAVADRVSAYDIWVSSVFSVCDSGSFFGPKDHTWLRKYNMSKNKAVAYLFKTVFVFATDIWHFANMVSWLSVVAVIFLSIYADDMYWLHGVLFIVARMTAFHLSYHHLLKT